VPKGLLAGALSLGSYWIALWAMTKAPIGAVAALRETSILFALLISIFFLKEPFTPWRALAGALIVAGAVALRFG
jgi:drug/metabolite transporter (DMT)-like permease